jgi:hypothetical protein
LIRFDRVWIGGWELTTVKELATTKGIATKGCSGVGGACWKKKGSMRRGREKDERVGRLTKPEDPEEADEAKFSGSERSHGAFAEEIDNDT